ncbi:MAG TPA: nucleotidyltransferase domain-containing protein [Candidatus Korarchaeota archaeon]|nr:nucleotidyltransferase domain-containing protein [Candidatus Korarchaeota archaeon]
MPSNSALRDVLEERVRARKEVIEKLRAYARRLSEEQGRVSVILFGSFARGDYNLWSDIDVIIVSESFKGARFVERCLGIRDPFGNLSPICWTPEEFEKMVRRPSWIKALEHSVVILDMHGVRERLRSEGITLAEE